MQQRKSRPDSFKKDAVRRLIARGSKTVTEIEGYPHDDPQPNDAGHFRGTRATYEARGFQAVEARKNHTVMRRAVG